MIDFQRGSEWRRWDLHIHTPFTRKNDCMEEKLLAMLEQFKTEIDKKNNTSIQYIPILRDNFIPYLLSNYQCNDLKSLFCDEMTRNGLINSAIYFIEHNENIRRISRLNFYLSSLSSLFNELLFEKYPNPNIQRLYPFTGLVEDICARLNEHGIMLGDSESYPSVSQEQFNHILWYLKSHQPKTIKNKQEHILIKLYLLYGLSPDKVGNLELKSYSPERKTLTIPCSIRKDLHVNVELPYTLSIEISNYISELLSSSFTSLFKTKTNKNIDSSFLSYTLNKIKVSYYKNKIIDNVLNPFTPTGLQKYAIIKMIEAGMNQSIIMDFTGQSQDIFNDCQSFMDELNQLNRNRYINHMIRGIETYDQI